MQKEVDAAIGLFPLSMLFMIGCTVLLFIYCKPVPSLKLGNRLLATCSNIISLALSFVVLILIERSIGMPASSTLTTEVFNHYFTWAGLIQQTSFMVLFGLVNLWIFRHRAVTWPLFFAPLAVAISTMVATEFAALFGLAADCTGYPAGESGCF